MKIAIQNIFLKLMFDILKNWHELDNDLSFLPERLKIAKIEKLVPNMHDKEEYAIYIRNLKQALNHGLVLRKMHRIIKFNQKAQLKSDKYEHGAKTNAKNDFKKYFFNLMNNAVFGKTMKNMRKHTDIKHVITEAKI